MALSRLLTTTASALDRRFGWDKLPRPLGVLTLVGLRTHLRQKNLYDTGEGSLVAPPADGRERAARTYDGIGAFGTSNPVTITDGDTAARAKVAAKLLHAVGRDDLPVAVGRATPVTPVAPRTSRSRSTRRSHACCTSARVTPAASACTDAVSNVSRQFLSRTFPGVAGWSR